MTPFSPTAPYNPFAQPTSLSYLLREGSEGYTPTDGFHIYTELRTTQFVQAAEDPNVAGKYVRLLSQYVNFGARAAEIFGVTLLEAQGEVLHFFLEGDRTKANLIKAIQFVYIFTRETYDVLRDELDSGWGGLASSLDGGQTVILRHSNYSSSSAISLAPAANRPAKRLLYGGTKARHLDIHRDSAVLLELPTNGEWHEMNLNRLLPYADERPEAGERQRLNEVVRAYKNELKEAAETIQITAVNKFPPYGTGINAPHRVQACAVRCDLDGFSAIVQTAFVTGRIFEVVQMFLEILKFGDHMLQTTPGAVQLPWAGDCATMILPDEGNSIGQSRWLEFSMRWQSEFEKGQGGLSESTTRYLKRQVASWAVGGCHGNSGLVMLAPIMAQGRRFLIAVGWPICKSLEAQNMGKGDEIVTRVEDYNKLDGAAKPLFRQSKNHNDYWLTKELTIEKLRNAAIQTGKSVAPNPQDYRSRVSGISVQPPRPYSA